MGFRMNAYAKVWSVAPGPGNFSKVRLSVSKKDKITGEYVQEFSGFCDFIGTAHAAASTLKEGDRIKLGEVDVTTTYNREQGREYINYKVFSFEKEDAAAPAPANVMPAATGNATEGDPQDMPF